MDRSDVTPLGRIVNRFSKDMDQIDVLLPDFLGKKADIIIQSVASHLILMKVNFFCFH